MIESRKFVGIVEGIAHNYENKEICLNELDRHFPSRQVAIDILKDLQKLIFPRYFGGETAALHHPQYYIGELAARIEENLAMQVSEALLFREPNMPLCKAQEKANKIVQNFMEHLPVIQRMLLTDVQAAFDGDPAAQSKEEIIFSYPGFFAIFVYRMAHELYVQDIPLVPRIMSEYAHSKTGVDINPGATIDEYFFIDHATGVVIGETTTIGKHVKVYQGVTLGALSTRAGQGLRGVKRHPTIEDNVTIYSNASVLGGETVIGEGSIIGGSAFVTASVPKNARVYLKAEVTVREGKPTPPGAFETI